ncbi:MAG: serine hydrolase domain-containing protein [Rhodanobacter sp.]
MSLAAEAAASTPVDLAQTKNATAIKVDASAPELRSSETRIGSRPPHTALLGPRLAPGTPVPPAELGPFVDGVVRTAMATDHIAGVTVAVVQDGQVVLKKGYGFAGPGRPVDPDRTLFRIGSISKTFTWIAAMKEVEAGRMRLDAPFNDYLPAGLAIPAVPGWRPVELRDLMSHTPGFEERMLEHMFVETPAQIVSLAAEIRRMTIERVFPPGTTPAYSNFGVMLVAEAVCYLEGASFQDVAEREIMAPLGMGHTTFREPYPPRADLPAPMSPTLAANVSEAYNWTGTVLKLEPSEWLAQVAPAGGASSTAGDMARYMLMILGDGELSGTRIFSPATALAFRTPIKLPVPSGGQVDHGFLQTQLPGGVMGYGHDGDTLWFHSNLVTVPALRLGIFVTTNTNTGAQLVKELPQLIVGHFYADPPGPPQSGSPALATKGAVYAGTYLPNRRPFSGLEKFVWIMFFQSSVDVTPDGYLVTQSGGEPETWVPTGRPGHFQAVEGPQTTDFVIRGSEAVQWYQQGGIASFDRVGLIYQRRTLLLIALLASAAAAITLIGPAIRFRRALPATRMQSVLNGAQLLAAGAWLIAAGAGIVFISGANEAHLVFDWPSAPMLTASFAALSASLLSIGILIALPFAWMADEGWGLWRKLRFSVASLLFCALGVQLGFWGFLEPWAT